MNGNTWLLIVCLFACLAGIAVCAGNDDAGEDDDTADDVGDDDVTDDDDSADDDTTEPIRVACVGDSITEISEYPADLQSLLGDGSLVGNFGHSGAVVSERFSDKTYLYQDEFDEAVAFLPQVVIILLGTNDSDKDIVPYIDEFVGDYTDLVDAFRSLDSAPIIWPVIPPPIFENTLGRTDTNLVTYVIPEIEEVAASPSLTTIDLHTPLAGRDDYFSDGLHPNAAGSLAIAEIIYSALVE